MPRKSITAKAEAIVAAPTKKVSAAKKPVPLLTASVIGEKLASIFEIPKSHGKASVDQSFRANEHDLEKGR